MKRFLRNNLIGIIAIALLICCGGVVYGAISTKSPDRGDNPMFYENPDKKDVFPEGKGYTLSKAKAQEYQLPEKDQQQQNLITGSASSSFNFSLGSFSFKGTRGNTGGIPSRKIDLNPSFKTDLKDQTLMEGTELTFKVEPTLFAGAKFTDKNITVKYGIKEISSSEKTDKGYKYTIEVREGKINVEITVTDIARSKNGKTYKTTKSYTITGSELEPVKTTVSMDAFEGMISASAETELKAGKTESAGDILDDVLVKKYGKGTTISSSGGKIISISGEFFKDEVILSEAKIQELTQAGFVEDEDFTISAGGGSISNGDYVLDDEKLESRWKILINGKEKSTKDKVSAGDKISLVFDISKK